MLAHQQCQQIIRNRLIRNHEHIANITYSPSIIYSLGPETKLGILTLAPTADYPRQEARKYRALPCLEPGLSLPVVQCSTNGATGTCGYACVGCVGAVCLCGSRQAADCGLPAVFDRLRAGPLQPRSDASVRARPFRLGSEPHAHLVQKLRPRQHTAGPATCRRFRQL